MIDDAGNDEIAATWMDDANAAMPADENAIMASGDSTSGSTYDLQAHGVNIGGYLPVTSMQVDGDGQIYWTHPATSSNAEYYRNSSPE